MSDYTSHLEGIINNVQALNAGDLRAREAAIESCRSLALALETPSEAIIRMTWNDPSHLAALRVAVDLQLFEHLVEDNDCPKSSAQLATACAAEPWLVARILKVFASMGTVQETALDSYAPNTFSKSMTRSIFGDSIKLMHDVCIHMNLKTAEYFREEGFKSPVDPMNTPAQRPYDADEKAHMIELISRNAGPQALSSMMATWMLDRPHWSEENFYPVKERLIEGATGDDDATFLVDVGGSGGHDVQKFLVTHGFETFPGHLVLQDLPSVISSIVENNLGPGIRAISHDFWTPQFIRGARVYFLHSIIHNYPDDKAQLILEHIAAAMRKGYSKLIIWDFVLPDKAAPATMAALDWEMMSFYAAGERTEAQWTKLLEQPDVGLKINGFWTYSQFDQAVIEAELA